MCNKGMVENNHCIKDLFFEIHFSVFSPKEEKLLPLYGFLLIILMS